MGEIRIGKLETVTYRVHELGLQTNLDLIRAAAAHKSKLNSLVKFMIDDHLETLGQVSRERPLIEFAVRELNLAHQFKIDPDAESALRALATKAPGSRTVRTVSLLDEVPSHVYSPKILQQRLKEARNLMSLQIRQTEETLAMRKRELLATTRENSPERRALEDKIATAEKAGQTDAEKTKQAHAAPPSLPMTPELYWTGQATLQLALKLQALKSKLDTEIKNVVSSYRKEALNFTSAVKAYVERSGSLAIMGAGLVPSLKYRPVEFEYGREIYSIKPDPRSNSGAAVISRKNITADRPAFELYVEKGSLPEAQKLVQIDGQVQLLDKARKALEAATLSRKH